MRSSAPISRLLRAIARLPRPRIETLVLLVALVCTGWAKWVILRRGQRPAAPAELAWAVLPDVVFFAAVFLLVSLVHLLRPSRWTARCALLISAVVLAWSILNAGWLIDSGVQLQPGILKLFVQDARQLWPLVKVHVAANPAYAAGLAAVVGVGLALFVWSVVRPRPVAPARAYHARRAGVAALVTVAAVVAPHLGRASPANGNDVAAVGFSSHQYALASMLTGAFERDGRPAHSRQLPRVGQRKVGLPQRPPADLPNVVLIALESIPRSATSLDDPGSEATPCLARLAREGADFRQTRTVVTHTTKALWAILTGTAPVIGDNYLEAVLADRPYEGLPSLLGRAGYRSAYFQVSKGTFECAPGLTANLGFQWAWFRENLADPSAHLGYLSGDDCRMIGPAFDWATRETKPFLLMMMTSVAHHPYELPEWFAQPKAEPEDRYLDSVRFTDHFLKRVCEALKARGLERNTILCILGDHGVSFRPGAGRAGGRWWPYEEVTHVPWVVWWPAHVGPGQRIDSPCSQMDVTPTLLKLIGFDVAEAAFEGRDAFGPIDASRRLHFSSWYADSPIGFVQGRRKVVYLPYLNKVLEYDLQADPGETHPKELGPRRIARIRRELLDWQRTTHVDFEAKRFRERFLYRHWQTFCAGRSAWAYYVP